MPLGTTAYADLKKPWSRHGVFTCRQYISAPGNTSSSFSVSKVWRRDSSKFWDLSHKYWGQTPELYTENQIITCTNNKTLVLRLQIRSCLSWTTSESILIRYHFPTRYFIVNTIDMALTTTTRRRQSNFTRWGKWVLIGVLVGAAILTVLLIW